MSEAKPHLHMPYLEPLGVPHYWGTEQSGQMAAAVMAYAERHEVTSLLRAYLSYVLAAPCWRRNPHATPAHIATLDRLAIQFSRATTADEIGLLIDQCMELGIDPL